jgi:hypothetical protein
MNPFGTGISARSSKFFVSSLSQAISTAIFEVVEATVA